MQTETHYHFSRMIFGNKIPPKILKQINNSLDNPTVAQKKMANIYQRKHKNVYYNPYDFLDLGKRSPHRRFNHDALMSSFIGFNLYGMDGVRAAQLHTWLDYVSDMMRKRYSRYWRDRFEIEFNRLYRRK